MRAIGTQLAGISPLGTQLAGSYRPLGTQLAGSDPYGLSLQALGGGVFALESNPNALPYSYRSSASMTARVANWMPNISGDQAAMGLGSFLLLLGAGYLISKQMKKSR